MAALTYADYLNAAKKLNVEVAAIRAVADVESSGDGFDVMGNLKKRFEPSWFQRLAGRSASSYSEAYAINPTMAMQANSWGKFQVMGFNYKEAGYNSVTAMVNSYSKSEKNQLDSFVTLIKSWGLEDELRSRNWSAFAYRYNGPNYAQGGYHTKMADRYAKYAADPSQNLIFGYTASSLGLGFALLILIGGSGYLAYEKGLLKQFKFLRK